MSSRPVQFGPVYRCWQCGRPTPGIIDFAVAMGGPTALDRFAEYIGYLNLSAECRSQRHPSRVARLGPAITPLCFPEGCSLEERVQAIREAVVYLTSMNIRREETLADRIAQIIHLVCVGAISPDKAIKAIRELLVEVEHDEVPMVR